jgi:hypothetical protein
MCPCNPSPPPFTSTTKTARSWQGGRRSTARKVSPDSFASGFVCHPRNDHPLFVHRSSNDPKTSLLGSWLQERHHVARGGRTLGDDVLQVLSLRQGDVRDDRRAIHLSHSLFASMTDLPSSTGQEERQDFLRFVKELQAKCEGDGSYLSEEIANARIDVTLFDALLIAVEAMEDSLLDQPHTRECAFTKSRSHSCTCGVNSLRDALSRIRSLPVHE